MSAETEPGLVFFRAFRRQDPDALQACLTQTDPVSQSTLLAVIQSVWSKDGAKSAIVALSNLSILDKPVFSGFLKYYLEGILNNRLGRKAKAISSFLKAEKIAQQQDASVWLSEVYLERSTVLSWMGQSQSALDDLLLAVALLSEMDFREAQQIAWLKLGQLYWERNDYLKSVRFLELSSALDCDSLSKDDRAKLNLELAQNYCELGDFSAAAAILASLEPDDLSSYTRFLHGLVEIRLHPRLVDSGSLEALEQKVRQTCDGSEWQTVAMQAALGGRLATEDPARAIELLTSAEKYFVSHSLASHLWRCLLNQVGAFLADGQQSAAEQALYRAKQVATEQGNRRLLEIVDEWSDKYGLSPGLEIIDNPQVSNTFGKATNGYVLLDELGRGGFGIVYRAFDLLRQQEVAFKTFDISDQSKAFMAHDMEVSLQKELQLVSKLRHPFIVTPEAYGKQREYCFYIVSRFIEGQNLRQLMTKEQSPEQITKVLLSMLDALLYAHQKGIIHRDIKPENILVDEHQQAHLIDFGNAITDIHQASEADSSGTALYMPPEAIKGGKPSTAQDIYALALVCCEMALGEHPFSQGVALNPIQYKFRLAQLKKSLLARLGDGVISQALMAALHYAPEKRPSAADFIAKLSS